MKKKKQYGIIALVLILVVVIAAGYYFYINRFDASAYVKAVLDVSYKNEIQEYVELTDTSEKELPNYTLYSVFHWLFFRKISRFSNQNLL